MSDYDFSTLNDKEFEVLATDLLGISNGVSIERFKPGRDGGVDGRFFSSDGLVVIQCKHWIRSPFSAFVKYMRDEELQKISRISPRRYILVVSYPLSPHQKKRLSDLLSPFVRSEADILGKEDLNDLISRYPQVEKRHYKLWLRSSGLLVSILNNAIEVRSRFHLDAVQSRAHLYVTTAAHSIALKKLENARVAIITGAPGVGKTTLANHLVLHFVAMGYEFMQIAEAIEEGEAVFADGRKQAFYFDDFLGENYLQAVSGHEGTHIARFIAMVRRSRDKIFVLTSRSSILNKGKSIFGQLTDINVQKNEFEVEIEALSEMDRAGILYNHIWHSGLTADYIDQLYLAKRYRHVIDHKNFNPRLVAFMTDPDRLGEVSSGMYWDHILRSLNNPADVWELPFNNQADDFGRALVALVVMHGKPISENVLSDAYHRYISLPENAHMVGTRDFYAALRLMTGAMLSRLLVGSSYRLISAFNPSVGDFVLQRLKSNPHLIRQCVFSLASESAVEALTSMLKNKLVTDVQVQRICEETMIGISGSAFAACDAPFIASIATLADLTRPPGRPRSDSYNECVHFCSSNAEEATANSIKLVVAAVERGEIEEPAAVAFAEVAISTVASDDEIQAAAELVYLVRDDHPQRGGLLELLETRVYQVASEDPESFMDVAEVLSGFDRNEEAQARRALVEAMRLRLDRLNIYPSYDSYSSDIVDGIDLRAALREHGLSYSSDYEDRSASHTVRELPTIPEISGVDDLFDRS